MPAKKSAKPTTKKSSAVSKPVAKAAPKARKAAPARKAGSVPASVVAPVSTTASAAALAVTPAQAVPPQIKPAITPEQRFEMIQREAYLIAEKNGFRGDPHGFWIAAEKHIADLLRK